MAKVTSTLSDDDRIATGEALQGMVVDLTDLHLLAKQLHWNLIGKRFRSIHLQLDEVVLFARDQVDIMAERAVAIGYNPNGQSVEVAKNSEVSPVEAGYITDDKVVTVMVDTLQAMVKRTRTRIETTDTSDPVTQDRLIAVAQGLEMQHWMFQAEQA